jgi:hypothetical protein
MAVAKKLGSSFETVRDKLKFRTVRVEFEDAAFDLKVRIPLKREMESILEKIQNPPKELISSIYDKFAAPLMATLKEGGQEFLTAINEGDKKIVVLDDDVIVDGTSIRQVALLTAMWQVRVEQYFHLLQSETGEPINESYDEISAEFPEQIVKLILDKIENSVKPDYQSTKKN